ncbi:ThiS, thiamine-biosynthesis protein [Marinomonas posidonica IVIA-Po-181]|uniref:ThiS, thiamine-biosynthesis protein n=2 Tax=Marinomonas TaxID=28253 RepID=F6CYR8_MARPP|nr:ThiS, thiamine-biosynthesis protein [Marinomonas posidonica IVIA-Po-181]
MRYLLLFMGIISTGVIASYPTGTNTVLGSYANRQSLITSSYNPAAPYLMTNISSFRAGFLGPLNLGFEMGDVKDLEDQVEDLEEVFDEDYSDAFTSLSASELSALGLSSSSTDAEIAEALLNSDNEVSRAIAQANRVLSNIGESAYVKFSGSVHAPFTPIIYKTNNRGAFTIDADASFVNRVGILADDIGLAVSGEEVDLATDTAVHVKKVTDYRFGIGYSQALGRPVSGALILGGKLNFHSMGLGQEVVLVSSDEDSSDSFDDFFMSRKNAQSNVSIDLGAIWTAKNYQLGATVKSLNEPEFDFDEIGNCEGLSGSSLSNCNAIGRLSNNGQLSLNETYKMKAQLTVDAAIMSTNQNWSLAASHDVNSVADPVGDRHQWNTVSLSYFSGNLFFPGIRLGYRKNESGSKLSYMTMGTTLFRRLDFDLAYSLEKVSGESIPRSLYLSLAYGFAF